MSERSALLIVLAMVFVFAGAFALGLYYGSIQGNLRLGPITIAYTGRHVKRNYGGFYWSIYIGDKYALHGPDPEMGST